MFKKYLIRNISTKPNFLDDTFLRCCCFSFLNWLLFVVFVHRKCMVFIPTNVFLYSVYPTIQLERVKIVLQEEQYPRTHIYIHTQRRNIHPIVCVRIFSCRSRKVKNIKFRIRFFPVSSCSKFVPIWRIYEIMPHVGH